MLLLAASANFPQRSTELCSLQLLGLQQLLILVLIKFVALNCLLLTSPAQSCAALRGDQALGWFLWCWLVWAQHVLRMRSHRNEQYERWGRWGIAQCWALLCSEENLETLTDLQMKHPHFAPEEWRKGSSLKVSISQHPPGATRLLCSPAGPRLTSPPEINGGMGCFEMRPFAQPGVFLL